MFELQYVSYVALHKMIKNCEWTGTWKWTVVISPVP
jgi:hypothetical protein